MVFALEPLADMSTVLSFLVIASSLEQDVP